MTVVPKAFLSSIAHSTCNHLFMYAWFPQYTSLRFELSILEINKTHLVSKIWMVSCCDNFCNTSCIHY